jgi:autotransporter translocation and assembly factor TamB
MRLRRWLARGLLALALVVIALAVASRTGAVRGLERDAVVRVLEGATGARVTLAGVGGTLGRSLVLEDLRLAAGGRTVAHVPRLEIVYAPLALLRGVLHLKRVTLTAPRVRVVRAAGGGLGAPDAGGGLPVEVDRLEIVGGRVAVALLDREAPRRFAATALTLAARGRLDRGGAELEVATLRFVPRGLAIAPVEAAGRVTGSPGGPVRLSGFHLASGRSRLDAEGTLDPMGALDAHVALAPLAAAEVRALVPRSELATDVRARVRIRGPRHALAVAARADFGPGGRLRGRAALDASAHPVAYAARIAFVGLDPGAVLPRLPRAAARGRIRVDGRGLEAAARHVRARLVLAHAELRGVPLARGAARAVVDGTRVRLASARVAGPALRANAAGNLDLARSVADLSLAARADLTRLGRRLGRPLGGTASLSASAAGPLTALAARATATVEHPLYGALGAERATVRLALDGLGSRAPHGTLQLEAPALRVARAKTPADAQASLEWRRDGVRDRARVTARAAGEAGRALALAATVERSGAHVTGRLEEATLALPGGPPWQLTAPAAFAIDDAFGTGGITFAAGAQRITLSGRVGLGGASDATLAVEHLALAPLCVLSDGPGCAGEVTAQATLGGTAAAPVVNARARAGDLMVDDVRYGVLSVDGHAAEARLSLHAVLEYPQAGELSANGTVPLDLAWAGPRRDLGGAPVDLALRADHLDLTALRALAPHAIRRSAGLATVDLRVTGTRAAPRPVGRLALEGGTLELAGTGLAYEDLRVRIAANGTMLDVEELHGRAGDGSVDGSGQLDVAPGGPLPLALTLRFDRFLALRRREVEAAVSGTLAARGALTAPEVSGTLDVEQAVLRPAGLPSTPRTLPSDPTITVVGLEEPPAPVVAEPSPGLPAPLALAVKINIAHDASVRRADANLALGGELALTKAHGELLRVSGQVRLLRGWFEFQGRRFDVREGTITLGGGMPPEPVFDVTATYRTAAYLVTVHITGSAEKPKLVLTAEPPLEQADILSVLLFGKPARELGRGQSLALQQQALQIATGYVVPELRSSVMNALGLDTLDVAVPDRSEAPGQVRVGRYVTQDVLLSLGQEFGTRVAQVVGIEYAVGTNVSVRASTSTRGASAVDLLWQRRY